jgi:hypothetical protein
MAAVDRCRVQAVSPYTLALTQLLPNDAKQMPVLFCGCHLSSRVKLRAECTQAVFGVLWISRLSVFKAIA